MKGDAVVDGHDVKEASVSLDRELRSAQVLITLRSEGAERSRAFTAANVKRRLAIVVEGKVENAPVILAEIGGGSVSINVGAGAPERQLADAKRLAARLTGGPLRP